MNNEERDLIARFVARVGGASQAGASGAGFGSSVPTTRPNLPPIDAEADRFIHQQLTQYPEATYRITQMAVVQEAAIAELQNRIQRLQWENQQIQQQAQQPQSRGLFGGLFGGGQRAAPPPGYGQQGGYGQQQGGYGAPPPQPQYAYPPNTNPGMFQRQGSGFLGSALTTAAGVAGGMVVGNALMDMFDGGGHAGGGFGGGGGGWGGGDAGGFGGDAGGGGDPFGGSGADTGGDAWGGGGGGDAGGGGDWGGGGGGDDSLF